MPFPDLEPAAQRLAELVRNVGDDELGKPTPCPDYSLGDLIEHVSGLSLGFAAAAAKQTGDITSRGPSADASRLDPDWRRAIPESLSALAAAWRDPTAWTGMTNIGGVEMPGEAAGIVGLDELVIHGWDIARASGQLYDASQEELEAVHGFVSQFASVDAPEGLFGPRVPVPDDAPLLGRVLGLTGRDPAWRPS